MKSNLFNIIIATFLIFNSQGIEVNNKSQPIYKHLRFYGHGIDSLSRLDLYKIEIINLPYGYTIYYMVDNHFLKKLRNLPKDRQKGSNVTFFLIKDHHLLYERWNSYNNKEYCILWAQKQKFEYLYPVLVSFKIYNKIYNYNYNKVINLTTEFCENKKPLNFTIKLKKHILNPKIMPEWVVFGREILPYKVFFERVKFITHDNEISMTLYPSKNIGFGKIFYDVTSEKLGEKYFQKDTIISVSKTYKLDNNNGTNFKPKYLYLNYLNDHHLKSYLLKKYNYFGFKSSLENTFYWNINKENLMNIKVKLNIIDQNNRQYFYQFFILKPEINKSSETKKKGTLKEDTTLKKQEKTNQNTSKNKDNNLSFFKIIFKNYWFVLLAFFVLVLVKYAILSKIKQGREQENR